MKTTYGRAQNPQERMLAAGYTMALKAGEWTGRQVTRTLICVVLNLYKVRMWIGGR